MQRQFAQSYGDLERWHWWFRGRLRILESVLRRELAGDRSRTILSIGCGPVAGLQWLRPFQGTHGRVIGLDVESWRAPETPHRIGFVRGRVEQAPFASASFDVVLLLDVLEHLDDDAAGLREAARLVRPGGLLLVTVPARPGLWGAQDVVSEHRRRYTKASLTRLLGDAALVDCRVGYFNALLFPLVAIVRRLRRAGGLADRARSDFLDNRPGPLNEVLAWVLGLEQHVINRVSLPIGVSLMAACRPPRRDEGQRLDFRIAPG